MKRVSGVIAMAAIMIPFSCWAQGPTIKSGGVVSASAFGQFASIAPGSWIEIYGSNLAADTRGWSGSDFKGVNAPTSLDGTSVTIGGQAAFIDYVSPGQVNAQVPSNVGTGSQSVVVTMGSVASPPYTINVNATQPGLLAPSSFSIGGKQYAVALFPDGATYVLPPGAITGVNSRRAQPGDTITLYGVGFGPVIPSIPAGQIVQQSNTLAATLQVQFGTTPAMMNYDGLAPNVVGLYQFNVVVPSVPASDAVPLTFTLGGVAGTQTLYLPVQGTVVPQVQSLTLSASSVAGGGTVQGTVTLSVPAPVGGAVVALSWSGSAASVPATVTVPAGATSATFTVSTSAVNANQPVIIIAIYGGGSAQALLTVTPGAPTFKQLVLYPTFSVTGYPSSPLSITVSPNNGTTTFTALVSPGFTLVDCAASNGGLTFACGSLGLGGGGLFTLPGYPTLGVTSASLQFTLSPGGVSSPYVGTLSGSLSVTGKVLGPGTPTVTLAGPLSGNYFVLY